MKCPTCTVNLLISDRNGVEIDYCPECRGIWLDRGELDKIIERYAGPTSSRDSHDRSREYSDGKRHHKKKRENPLEELFDFF